nr:endonuclease/exonuclease/phosphatase family protein [Prolixibacteraceae bacterium]
TTLYRLTRASTIWLSDTGNVGSMGWDAAYPRICTYGLFEHKETNQKIWVLNTHFDHIGNVARQESAQLILRKIKTLNTEIYPVALMGDFNLTPLTKPIQSIKKQMKDAFDVSQKQHYGPTGTFNGFDPNNKLDTRIDYIFVQNIKVNSIIHIDDKRDDGFFISDHLPVLCKLQLYPEFD